MNNKKIKKGYRTIFSSTFHEDTYRDGFQTGIVYTLYSEKFNSLKVGFAKNYKVLENNLSSESLILLDRKKGKKEDLILLINTLNELGIKSSGNLFFKCLVAILTKFSGFQASSQSEDFLLEGVNGNKATANIPELINFST